MGFRREPRTIPERLADLEERLRRMTSTVVVRGSGVGPGGLPTGLISAPGDTIVGGPTNPERLPVGPVGTVLTSDPTSSAGVSWQPIPVPTDTAGDEAQMLLALMDEG